MAKRNYKTCPGGLDCTPWRINAMCPEHGDRDRIILLDGAARGGALICCGVSLASLLIHGLTLFGLGLLIGAGLCCIFYWALYWEYKTP